MNRFLVHFICAFVPVKKYRKALRDYLYSFDFAKISYKVREFRSLENETQTVVLGSSHALYGYKPERTEFNFAEPSQDLYYSYKIYEKFCDFKKIKRVILFYSVFSAGHILEKTRWVKLCAIYKKVLGIPYRYDETELKKIEKKLHGRIYFMPRKTYGDMDKYRFESHNAEERVAGHLKNNRRQNNQTEYVEKCAALARLKGHDLFVVIPPFRSDYTKLLPPFEEVFAPLLSLTQKDASIHLLDYFHDTDFADDDFGDTDHLNLQGAKKLTQKIRQAFRTR